MFAGLEYPKLHCSVSRKEMSSIIPSPPFTRPNEISSNFKLSTDVPDHSCLTLNASNVADFLVNEVSVQDLNDIEQHLWLAGRPGHIRPLHRQKMLKREMIITENPGMHLVWYENTIFLKPIPAALMSWEFWQQHVCADDVNDKDDGELGATRQRKYLYSSACGFLASYTKLITHLSDFNIAREIGLIPPIEWTTWCRFARDITNAVSAPQFPLEKRWRFGELRLTRLNWIYKLTMRRYSYFFAYTNYGTYFGRNAQMLLFLFGYSSVLLTAMQVVLVTENVPSYVNVMSYHVGIIVIFLLFAVACLFGVVFGVAFVYHLLDTLIDLSKEQKHSIA